MSDTLPRPCGHSAKVSYCTGRGFGRRERLLGIGAAAKEEQYSGEHGHWSKYTTVARYEMLRCAQHDNRGVIPGHAERSRAESKHLSPPMPNVHWITVVYLGHWLRIGWAGERGKRRVLVWNLCLYCLVIPTYVSANSNSLVCLLSLGILRG